MIVGLLVIVVALVIGWLAYDTPAESPNRLVFAVAAVVALPVGVWLMIRRRSH